MIMAIKKIKEKAKVKIGENRPPSAAERKKARRYFGGVGRRKLAVARVRIFEIDSKVEKDGAKDQNIEVNEKPYAQYFSLSDLKEIVVSPAKVLGTGKKITISVRVRGGGIRGQAEATRLGIARALTSFDENLRKPLRDLGFLTRDDRIVERKKAGLKKARRAPQWQKR